MWQHTQPMSAQHWCPEFDLTTQHPWGEGLCVGPRPSNNHVDFNCGFATKWLHLY